MDGLNQMMFQLVLTASDFNIPGSTPPGGSTPAGTVTTLFGASIATSITVNGHVWTVGADGVFHTTTNLAAEWENYFNIMQAGQGNTLTAVQRWEGNAEAVFEFTKLGSDASGAKAQAWREDAQREFDAVAAIMAQLGLGSTLLTTQNYLAICNALQANPALEELAIEGHGLNDPPLAKYDGYTQNFQNNSDTVTYYVGGGLNQGQKAVASFFDDSIMTHLPFPTVEENGTEEVLNQNGNAEDTLVAAVQALNNTLFTRVYVASDFSTSSTAVGAVVTVPNAPTTAPPAPVAGAGQMTTLSGAVISTTITDLPHVWTADANGLFQTTTDLTLEWYTLYHEALAGASLTYVQRLEANAEAVFENTGLSALSENQQEVDREDIQREIDAIAGAMKEAGLSGITSLTTQDYLTLGHVLQSDATLEELALQGHGLNHPPSSRYDGFTNDMQNNVDSHTLYIGGGVNTGERAIADFLDDSVLSHLPFPVIIKNGELEQLNQNGDVENTLSAAVAALNASMFTQLYTAADFLVPGRGPAAAPPTGAASVTTLDGTVISNTISGVTAHVWVADANGQFYTTANLEMEWRAAYQTMLACQGNTLTPLQRLEGNAEAVFENTGISNASAAQEEYARETLQRTFDAIDAAMKIDQQTLGISDTAAFTQQSYLQLQETLQGPSLTSETLEELALQGEGQVVPILPQYRGYAYNVQGWFELNHLLCRRRAGQRQAGGVQLPGRCHHDATAVRQRDAGRPVRAVRPARQPEPDGGAGSRGAERYDVPPGLCRRRLQQERDRDGAGGAGARRAGRRRRRHFLYRRAGQGGDAGRHRHRQCADRQRPHLDRRRRRAVPHDQSGGRMDRPVPGGAGRRRPHRHPASGSECRGGDRGDQPERAELQRRRPGDAAGLSRGHAAPVRRHGGGDEDRRAQPQHAVDRAYLSGPAEDADDQRGAGGTGAAGARHRQPAGSKVPRLQRRHRHQLRPHYLCGRRCRQWRQRARHVPGGQHPLQSALRHHFPQRHAAAGSTSTPGSRTPWPRP